MSGRAQHVRRMRSSIASVINSVLEFRSARFVVAVERYHTVVLTGDRSYIFLLSAKNAARIFWKNLSARFKKFSLLSTTILQNAK